MKNILLTFDPKETTDEPVLPLPTRAKEFPTAIIGVSHWGLDQADAKYSLQGSIDGYKWFAVSANNAMAQNAAAIAITAFPAANKVVVGSDQTGVFTDTAVVYIEKTVGVETTLERYTVIESSYDGGEDETTFTLDADMEEPDSAELWVGKTTSVIPDTTKLVYEQYRLTTSKGTCTKGMVEFTGQMKNFNI